MLAFEPGADVLVSGGLDRRVLEWRLGVETLVDKARRIAGRNLSAAEWRQYVGPGVPYERAFDSLPDGEGVTPADRHASGSATRALIGAALVAWIPLMLVVPWWSVRQSMRRTGLFVLYPVAIGAVLVAALQLVAFVPGVNSVTLDLGLRALAMIAIAVAAAWAQKFLELHPTWVRPRPRRR